MARVPITKANPYYSRKHKRWFQTEREYRNFLAERRGHPSWHAQQKAGKAIRSRGRFEPLSRAEKEAHARALDALAEMRRTGLSLTRAAGRAGTTPNTVRRYAGSALERGPRRRIIASSADRLYRRMPVLTTEGVREVELHGSRAASLIGRHWNAVQHYLRTGDESELREFSGKTVAGLRLETDADAIDAGARTGELGEVEIASSQPL